MSRLCSLLLLCASWAWCAVTRVEILKRADLPVAGYERISGKVHFVLNPKLAANKPIVDLALAPKNGQGQVEFSADFLVFRAKNPAKSNGTLLMGIANRGTSSIWTSLNLGSNSAMTAAKDFGDNFLLSQGYTVAWVGWQWDAPARSDTFKVYAPVVPNVKGPVRFEILPNNKQTSEPLPYPVADLNSGTLTVRDAPYGPRQTLPKGAWRYSADHSKVEFTTPLTPGRIYEFVYTAKDPVVAGVGLAAVRDYISYVKKNGVAGSTNTPIQRAIGFGISQSGRMLRTMLYEGFNADEQGKQVFDGMWAHVSGAGHGGFNQRFAQPTKTTGQYSGSFYPTDQSPFAPGELMEKAIEAKVAPKLILTNGSHEYWGRGAVLNHITEDGSRDLDPPSNVRIYFIAGIQHSGAGGVVNPTVQNVTNSLEVSFVLRATLTNLNAWITHNTAPPPTNVPRMDKNQLVPISALKFPYIPNFGMVHYAYAPRHFDWGPEYLTNGIVAWEPGHAGGAYPVLVPQVDADGIDVGGVRMPELVWPLMTYTGWNPRNPSVGAPDQQYSLIGSQAPFARTKVEREKTGDPRLSVSERYSSKAQYISHIETTAQQLIGQRFLLESDLDNVSRLAGRHWDQVMNPSAK